MKKHWLFALLWLIIPGFLMAQNSLSQHDLVGYWNWQSPKWANDGSRNFIWLDYTLICRHDQTGYSYTLQNEKNELIDKGSYSVQNGLLTLNPRKGLKEEYYMEKAPVGKGFQLVRANRGQAPYFSLSPKSPIWTEEARKLNNQKNYAEALKMANMAHQADLGNKSALFQMAFAYGGLEDYKNAIFFYKEVLKQAPDDKAAQSNLKWCQDRLEKRRTKNLQETMEKHTK